MKKKLSVIVPCYNEEESLDSFYNEINKVSQEMKELIFEFIFVDDGSHDKTLVKLKELSKKDERVRYISFSRNFGKEAAMYAGMENSTGDYVTIIDADLQHPPKLLIEMYDSIINEGYDCVATRKGTRNDESFFRTLFSKMFYKLINKISVIEMVDGACDYRLMTRKMINAILSMKEYNRYSKGLFSFVGFKTKWIDFSPADREHGQTKWNFWKLFSYAIEGIVGYSTKPLSLSIVFGILFNIAAFILLIIVLVRRLVWLIPISSIILLAILILIVSGIQLLCLGIVGIYMSKSYLEIKKRPVYVIKETEKD